MRHLAAYLLLVLGGKAAPTAAEVKAVLAAAGIEGDDARIATLLKELEVLLFIFFCPVELAACLWFL